MYISEGRPHKGGQAAEGCSASRNAMLYIRRGSGSCHDIANAGRIELTSERSDLEKEVNGLTSDLETAANLRNKEHSDYEAATKEMSLAIKSLNTAVKVLHEATKESKSSLVSLRAHLSQEALAGETEGFSARLAEADELERAVKVGSRLLKSSDALFLRRLLSGEVPQADWKKLNRKADFKMKYKARSVKIQDIPSQLA